MISRARWIAEAAGSPAAARSLAWALVPMLVLALAAGCGGDGGGTSPEAPADTAPLACFVISPSQVLPGTEFGLDASCSRDANDPVDSLAVRWDWESDGAWDTEWTREKIVTHRLEVAGRWRITLEVRDAQGQTGQISRLVSVTEEIPSIPIAGFIVAPSGGFTMGSPSDEPGRQPDEVPHEVAILHPFLLGEREVTQREWTEVMGWNPSYFTGDDRPVDSVTWFDCIAFCIQKSEAAGLRPAYQLDADTIRVGRHIVAGTVRWDTSSTAWRLPTEAEWEYACRAGSTTPLANGTLTDRYCGSNPALDAAGWFCGNARDRTHPAGEKVPNAWGLFDAHGNVQEWCWDWSGAYPDSAVADPVGAAEGAWRILRGGSWSTWAQSCRSAARGGRDPGAFSHEAGFRLARSIRPEKTAIRTPRSSAFAGRG